MNIELAEILSIAALIVSIFSMLYTKKQAKFAQKNLSNDYRSNLSQYHLVYRKALIETQKKHKNDFRELSTLARETLVNIVNLFDQYDTNRHAIRYLRHLLHESSEMVFCTFQGQLTWQTAENISHRLYQISFIEDKLNPLENIYEEGSFRKAIHSKYTSNPNDYLERYLIHDIYFCNLVSELKSRIDQSRLQDLINHVQEEVNKFNKLHKDLKSKFSKSANDLKDLIYQGNKEHFPLKESPQLFNEMNKTKTTLNTLGYIDIPEQLNNPCIGYYFFVSRSIYLCTLLHAIECLDSWGWSHE